MSVTLSNTTYPPGTSIPKESKYRNKESDRKMKAYRHIQIDGINYDEEEWNVVWIPMAPATARALETILVNSIKGTSNYLYWQGVGETTSKYYTAYEVSRAIIAPNLIRVSAILRRVFPTL